MLASNLKFCHHLAKGVAQQFGPNCEVVVHDFTAKDLNHTIVAIENGHVSGRKIGDGPTQMVLEAIQHDSSLLEDRFAYLTRSNDGKILKSTTVYLRDNDGKPYGVFAINYDISVLLSVEHALKGFTGSDPGHAHPTAIPRNVSSLLDDLIDQSVRLVGRPVALMNKEDKVRAIQFLNKTGAFLITKSGDRVCKHFGISKYTLYSYIDEAKSE